MGPGPAAQIWEEFLQWTSRGSSHESGNILIILKKTFVVYYFCYLFFTLIYIYLCIFNSMMLKNIAREKRSLSEALAVQSLLPTSIKLNSLVSLFKHKYLVQTKIWIEKGNLNTFTPRFFLSSVSVVEGFFSSSSDENTLTFLCIFKNMWWKCCCSRTLKSPLLSRLKVFLWLSVAGTWWASLRLALEKHWL